MDIIFTKHANERLREPRQKRVRKQEVIERARNIPGKFFKPAKMRFMTKFGSFSLVIHDNGNIRTIVTIVGQK